MGSEIRRPDWATCGSATDAGRVRSANQDCYLLEPWADGSALLAVIADGMGGYQGGAVAASITIDQFKALLEDPLPSDPATQYDRLLEQFYLADEAIRHQSMQRFDLSSMGATVMAAIITPHRYLHLYAGDCRLYHFRNHTLLYRSRDHSVVQVLQTLGQITAEEATIHPMKSIVSSCLGGERKTPFVVDPKWNSEAPPIYECCAGDLLLLSTDGLHGEVLPEQLQQLVDRFGHDPQQLAQACIQSANEHGGQDNVTALSIRLVSEAP